MWGRRRSSQLQVEAEPAKQRGVDFAWKTHSAITDWTAKVDAKAAIVLSLGGVLLGFFVTLSDDNRALDNLVGWRFIVERIGLGLMALGVIGAGLVVAPRLNRKQAKK